MEYKRRIVPPSLKGTRPPPELILEMDDDWEELDPTRRSSAPKAPKRGLFPPARSDAEIEAIVDEFTDELCGALYSY